MATNIPNSKPMGLQAWAQWLLFCKEWDKSYRKIKNAVWILSTKPISPI